MKFIFLLVDKLVLFFFVCLFIYLLMIRWFLVDLFCSRNEMFFAADGNESPDRIYISFCLAHSGQMMSVSSVMKPRPTSDVLQEAQVKQSLCQWRSSNEMKRVPPMPAIKYTKNIHKSNQLLFFFSIFIHLALRHFVASLVYAPVIGFMHAVHLLAKSSPKHSAQYGFSSRLVKRCPANDVEQLVHVKHSRCHGSFLYVTPPEVMICGRGRIDKKSMW